MPNTPNAVKCSIEGLRCLNEHYEELSVVIAKWSKKKKGVVCDCMPSCTELDIAVVHDGRDKYNPCFFVSMFLVLYNTFLCSIYGDAKPMSLVTLRLDSLPTERYKRNVIRGKLDLVGKSN